MGFNDEKSPWLQFLEDHWQEPGYEDAAPRAKKYFKPNMYVGLKPIHNDNPVKVADLDCVEQVFRPYEEKVYEQHK